MPCSARAPLLLTGSVCKGQVGSCEADAVGQAMGQAMQASAISVAAAALTDADLGSGLIPLTPVVPAPQPVRKANPSCQSHLISDKQRSADTFKHHPSTKFGASNPPLDGPHLLPRSASGAQQLHEALRPGLARRRRQLWSLGRSAARPRACPPTRWSTSRRLRLQHRSPGRSLSRSPRWRCPPGPSRPSGRPSPPSRSQVRSRPADSCGRLQACRRQATQHFPAREHEWSPA